MLAPLALNLSLVGVHGHCGTRRDPCVVSSVVGVDAQVATQPPGSAPPPAVTFTLVHRVPATLHWMSVAATPSAALSPTGTASLDLAPATLAGQPGETCVTATLPATTAEPAQRSPERCVRYRPPVTIGWASDITLGSAAYGDPPGDGSSLFAHVRALVRAPDLTIGNLEGTLSTGGTPRCTGGAKCFIFEAPPRNAAALASAGLDVMNQSNNHALDMGDAARAQTVRALAAHGIATTGLPGEITIEQVADTRVAIVGFGFTAGTMLISDLPLERTMIRRARREADVVVVVMHAGTEGAASAHVPHGDEAGRGNTRAFVATALDSGAAVVFGSSPHVLRGIQELHHHLAFYSTGNFAGWHNFAMGGPSSQSAFATVTLGPDGHTAGARVTGLRLTGPGIPVIDRSGGSVRTIRRLSRADFGATAAQISSGGAITVR